MTNRPNLPGRVQQLLEAHVREIRGRRKAAVDRLDHLRLDQAGVEQHIVELDAEFADCIEAMGGDPDQALPEGQ